MSIVGPPDEGREGALRRRTRQGDVGQMNSWAQLRMLQWQRVGMVFLQVRPVIVGLGLLVLGPLLLWSSTPQRQCVRLLVGFGVMLSFFVWEAWDVRHRPLSQVRLFGSLVVTILGIGVAVWNSGGIDSVVLPLWLAPVVVGFAAFGKRRWSWALALLVIFGVVGFSLAPTHWVGASLGSDVVIVSRVVVMCMSVALSYFGVAGLVDAQERAGQLVEVAREQTRSLYQQRNEDMVVLSAQLAHEIKNPMTAIKGLVQLSRRDASTKQARRLEVMETELERLEHLTHNYLSLSTPMRVEHRGPVALDVVMSELGVLWSGHPIDFDGEPAVVLGDEAKIKQILMNLIQNALNAVEEVEQPRVEVTWACEGEEVVVMVRDNGHGMSPEVRAQYGSPFFSTRARGTGLGVMVARTLVEQHGGRLILHPSNASSGVCVSVSLLKG